MEEKQEAVVEKVRLFGGSASEAVLDPYSQIFQTPKVNGLIGYRCEKSCAVVFGDPVCNPSDRASLVGSFHESCQEKGQNVLYLTASKNFYDWTKTHPEYFSAAVEFGRELFLNPEITDPRNYQGVKGSLVRRKVRHATSDGVVVKEYTTKNPDIEKAIQAVADEWLERRQGPQIHTSHIHLFAHRKGKRWFYAERNGKVIGVLTLNQIKAQKGWLLNRYLVTKDAPGGTPELLIISVIEALRTEGCGFLNLGTVPGDRLNHIQGLGSIASFVSQVLFRAANWMFHLDGKRQFWEKFHPESEGSYLLFSRSQIGLSEVRGLMNSMNVSF